MSVSNLPSSRKTDNRVMTSTAFIDLLKRKLTDFIYFNVMVNNKIIIPLIFSDYVHKLYKFL